MFAAFVLDVPMPTSQLGAKIDFFDQVPAAVALRDRAAELELDAEELSLASCE